VKVEKKYLFGSEIVEVLMSILVYSNYLQILIIVYFQFIEKDMLRNVFLHEYIFRSQVKFSLAWIVRDRESLLLVFHDLYPGYAALKEVYLACFKEMQ
jgi:hypothetical protein